MTVYGIYKNTDMTEGRGMQYLDRIFATEEMAIAWRETQRDYPNWPYHQIKPVEFPFEDIYSALGMVMPR